MVRLILFLAVAIVLATFAVWLADQPGQVVVEWGGLARTYAVGTAVAIVAAVAALAIVAFEVLRWLGAVPARWRRSTRHKRELRGYEATMRGLVAAAGGDRTAAAFHGRQAAKLAPERAGTLLLQAQTAQLDGREEEARTAFRAMLADPGAELLGLRGLLSQAMKSGDRAEALDLARRAHKLSPRTPWVLQTLFELLTRGESWQEALGILDGLAREKLVEPGIADRRRGILLHMAAREQQRQGRIAEALATAKRAVKAAPGFTPAALLANQLAGEAGRRRAARRALEMAWAAEPTLELAEAWAQLHPSDSPLRRFDRMRPLERMRPDHVVTQLALGEAALAAGRLDPAREHLTRAEALGATVRVCRALSELEGQAGDADKALRWSQRSAEARPDRAWVCEETGEVLPAWEPFGPTGKFDSIRWTEPPRLTRLTPAVERSLLVPVAVVPEPHVLPPQPALRPVADITTAAA